MPKIKWSVESGSPTQGYPSDTILKKDIETLSKQYALYKKDGNSDDNDVRKMILGQACAQLLERKEVLEKLESIVSAVKQWTSKDGTNTNPKVSLHMGPLKKIERIMQKAVHYAVEPTTDSATGSSTLLLQRVCDVLRATIVVSTDQLYEEKFGSSLIDIVNTTFSGKVVSVKNRFMLSSCPELVTWDGKEIKIDTHNKLAQDLDELVNLNLLGRDSFYRDMAMLIKLENSKFANGQGLSHVYLELQIASESLHNAKSPEEKTGISGHDAYKLLRTIAEHAEYQRWTKGGTVTPALPSAFTFYPPPKFSDWVKFPRYLELMWQLYRDNQKICKPMWNAIDQSQWYAKSTKA